MIFESLQLSECDLLRYRRAWAKQEAVEINPRAYTASETEQIIEEYARVHGAIIRDYGLDDR